MRTTGHSGHTVSLAVVPGSSYLPSTCQGHRKAAPVDRFERDRLVANQARTSMVGHPRELGTPGEDLSTS